MNIKIIAFFTWLFAIGVWQLIFNAHPVVAPILWEIHTIFTSVILLYAVLSFLVTEKELNFIKIIFRIIFKVWLIIFIAFSMNKSFNQKGFILTATFVFGYLEGLIDINSSINDSNSVALFSFIKKPITKNDKTTTSIIIISAIHFLCALIAVIFFNIK